MSEQLRIILIIIVSVSIFGLLVFVFVRNYIKNKIEERIKAKKNGNFTLADKIREELSSKGIIIEDQKDKTIWKVK